MCDDYFDYVYRTTQPLNAMIDWMRENINKYDDLIIKNEYRFQIRFHRDFYENILTDEHKEILASKSTNHKMALCNHYVYQYDSMSSYTVECQKRKHDDYGYYNRVSVGEVGFFDYEKYPKLVSVNMGKSAGQDFMILEVEHS